MSQYFTDVFAVSQRVLERHGAFNVSLVADLPLFVDPFLVFNSRKRRYRALHRDIVRYLEFLFEKAKSQELSPELVNAWYRFPEIEENWLGFSKTGNRGHGLGPKFAGALHSNLGVLFGGLNDSRITKDVHLEKLCLVSDRVGRDNISDFTNNLIHGYLLEFTSAFAEKHIPPAKRRRRTVRRVRFNYRTESWEADSFDLPVHEGRHVLLTPRDLLTKDDTWINKSDLFEDFDSIPDAIPNPQLRAQIDNYFRGLLPKRTKKPPTKEQRNDAISRTLRQFPDLIDYYIRNKEEHGDEAVTLSSGRVEDSRQLFVEQARGLTETLAKETRFYQTEPNSLEAARQRVMFLKDAIENKGCHRIFYVKGKPIQREADLQVLYRLTWLDTSFDVSREVNDGRGPVDFKVSRGRRDKVLVEMKLADNAHLERNLARQTAIYEKASDAPRSLKVILFFSDAELARVRRILRKLKLERDQDIQLIDARAGNKPSGSRA